MLKNEPVTGESRNVFKVGLIQEKLSSLTGEMLTLVEASVEIEKQKAVKDLVRQSFGRTIEFFIEKSWGTENAGRYGGDVVAYEEKKPKTRIQTNK